MGGIDQGPARWRCGRDAGCAGTFNEKRCVHFFASCGREVRITMETAKFDDDGGGDPGVWYWLADKGKLPQFSC